MQQIDAFIQAAPPAAATAQTPSIHVNPKFVQPAPRFPSTKPPPSKTPVPRQFSPEVSLVHPSCHPLEQHNDACGYAPFAARQYSNYPFQILVMHSLTRVNLLLEGLLPKQER